MQDKIIFLRFFSGGELPHEDALFLDARRAFFSKMEEDENRVQRTEYDINGVRRACQYRFNNKKPVWIVREGRRAVQKLVCRKDGSYVVLTLDEKGLIVREELYSAIDTWLGITEYRDGRMATHAQPGGDGTLIAQQVITEDRSVRNLRLVACPSVLWDNKEVLQAVMRECGLPQAVAFTQNSAYCYYEERLAEQANRCAARFPVHATFVAAKLRADDEPQEKTEPDAGERKDKLFDEIFGEVTQDAECGVHEPLTPSDAICHGITQKVDLPTLEELFSDAEQNAAQPSQKIMEAQEPLPSLEELFADTPPDSQKEPEKPEVRVQQPEFERRIFEGQEYSALLEFNRDGTRVYAGGVRAEERDGFGVSADLDMKSAFAGVWLYGGRCGVMTSQSEDGTIRVRFEDSASQNPEMPEGPNCIFGADGGLIFAGQMSGEQRSGFGVAKWGEAGHRYLGMWQQNQPHGRGLEQDADGMPVYEGEWKSGKRDGFGTEFEQGKPVYSGNWSNNQRCGSGVMTKKDGNRLVGNFDGDELTGFATEYDADGVKVYEGEWKNGVRCGEGSLFLISGGRIDGRFKQGELTGTAVEFNAAGSMVYRGAFSGTMRHGRGTLFENGEAVYEGDFSHDRFDGNGKQMENGVTVYVGAFSDGMRSGVGASFRQGKPFYFGQWENGVRSGCGVEYHDGEPVFAGCFENGVRSGRGNEYGRGVLQREVVCKNGEPVYMLEYGANGEPEYIGAVYCGKRSGMGRLLGQNCECEEQGIFSEGKLVQPVQVIVQPLEELPCPEELRGSTYESLANPQLHCVVEVPFAGGRYSGYWCGGKPQGKGTLLFSDHCYAGGFYNGVPNGEGKLFLSTGKTIEGHFAAEGGERILCGDCAYFVTRN